MGARTVPYPWTQVGRALAGSSPEILAPSISRQLRVEMSGKQLQDYAPWTPKPPRWI